MKCPKDCSANGKTAMVHVNNSDCVWIGRRKECVNTMDCPENVTRCLECTKFMVLEGV